MICEQCGRRVRSGTVQVIALLRPNSPVEEEFCSKACARVWWLNNGRLTNIDHYEKEVTDA